MDFCYLTDRLRVKLGQGKRPDCDVREGLDDSDVREGLDDGDICESLDDCDVRDGSAHLWVA
jgi:hypothetical protein